MSSSIVYGVLVWVLGLSFYFLSFYVPILENLELQSNIVLTLAIIPFASLGTYLFYKKQFRQPSYLALTWIAVSIILYSLITMPFIVTDGGSYSTFFGGPMFYILVVEFYFTTLFFGDYLIENQYNDGNSN